KTKGLPREAWSSQMSAAYERPFHPIDFCDQAAATFPLCEMIDQLRREDVYAVSRRNALTLIRDEGLAAVLIVAREGAQCEEHFSQELTLFIVLEGALSIESASNRKRISLATCSAGALAPNVRHQLRAITDCAYLVVMGHHTRGDRTTATPAIEA